jgi:hypothetical protein
LQKGLKFLLTSVPTNGSTKIFSAGDNRFYVQENGYMYASRGTIGGWSISSSSLTGGSVTLSSSGKIEVGSYFTADGNGITATGGTVGGWYIGSNKISS